MRSSNIHSSPGKVIFAAALMISAAAALSASAGTPLVAVYSRTLHGYTRTLQPDNSYKPETYAFADGGRLDADIVDPSIDNLKFGQVAGVIAASLKRENYVATTNPRAADLLIFVSYGTTTGIDEGGYQNAMSTLSTDFRLMNDGANGTGGLANLGPNATGSGTEGIDFATELKNSREVAFDVSLDRIALANQARDRLNEFNARVLGYSEAWHDTNVMRPYLQTARDILKEIEESRYFVVLQAYDFQALRNHQGRKLLWETRYSIPRHGVRFDEQIVDMTHFAAQFYGQNLDHLIRRHLREGRVDVGTPEVVPASTR